MKFSVNNPCPCGSGKKYKKCCGILHKGVIAKDALELMKSCYSAFAVDNSFREKSRFINIERKTTLFIRWI